MKWKWIPVSEVCEQIVDCVNRTAPIVDYETPYKMIRTTNIRDGRIDLVNTRRVTKEIYEKWTRRLVPIPGDVFLTREAPLGEVAMLRSAEPVFLGQRVMHYRVDSKKMNAVFLNYVLQSHQVQGEIRKFSTGSTVGHMRVNDAKNFRVPVPPLSTQHRIADILSAYDDLIENNNRRMALLEESIHLLYKEWFVYLRFPGHEHTEIVDGVPEGWEKAPCKSVIDFNPKTSILNDMERPYVPMSSLTEDSMIIDNVETRVPKGGARFKNNDTLLARITPCLENGKTGFVQFLETAEESASGSTEYIVMRSKTATPCWVYSIARSYKFREEAIQRMTGADGRQRVDWKSLANLELLIPDIKLIEKYESFVGREFEQIHQLTNYNQKLREARDLLLPRLMDGRIPV